MNNDKKKFIDPNIKLNQDSSNIQVKTTNVNILLNRVRLEKKKTLNKRILISLSLVSLISLSAVFLIIQS